MIRIKILKIAVVIAALLLAAVAGILIARADGSGDAPRPTPTTQPISPVVTPEPTGTNGDTGAVTLANFGPESPDTAWLGVLALLAVVIITLVAWLSSRNNET